MQTNIILEYFDNLKDDEGMYVEFVNGEKLLLDNRDIIRAAGNVIEIKSDFGRLITENKDITGLRISKRSDIIQNAMMRNIIEEIGDL